MKQLMRVFVYMVCLAWPLVSFSGEPPPFVDFSHKSVKVPSRGAGNLINVQIDPSASVFRSVVADEEPETTPEPNAGQFGWFWDEVSPGQNVGASNRLEDAVNVLQTKGGANGLVLPRVQNLQALVNQFGTDILVASIGTQVSPALVLAVIAVESGGRGDAISTAGAIGLMQLIPATAARFGVDDPKNPADNINGGVAYLDWLMKEFDADPVLVLAAYNAGENAVRRFDGVPEYPETRAYVPKVLAAWSVARLLCRTPPELVSDGCVFANQEAQN